VAAPLLKCNTPPTLRFWPRQIAPKKNNFSARFVLLNVVLCQYYSIVYNFQKVRKKGTSGQAMKMECMELWDVTEGRVSSVSKQIMY
jgi:hypothetical protein